MYADERNYEAALQRGAASLYLVHESSRARLGVRLVVLCALCLDELFGAFGRAGITEIVDGDGVTCGAVCDGIV